MANIGFRGNEAYGYFEFIQGHEYSDIAYVELIASRDTSLCEHDIERKYTTEQLKTALREGTKLIKEGWEEVRLVFHLHDKKTMSHSYFAITVRYGKETTLEMGVSLKKERDGRD